MQLTRFLSVWSLAVYTKYTGSFVLNGVLKKINKLIINYRRVLTEIVYQRRLMDASSLTLTAYPYTLSLF